MNPLGLTFFDKLVSRDKMQQHRSNETLKKFSELQAKGSITQMYVSESLRDAITPKILRG